MSRRLNGQVAVITGASRGIGRAAARAWAREGAVIVAASRSQAALDDVCNELREFGGDHQAVACDVSNPDDVAKLAATATALGGAAVLFNCAGVPGVYAPLTDVPIDVWRRTVEVNLTGTFLCCKAMLPAMIRNRHGSIINVASSDRALPMRSAYHATKFGIVALTQSLAAEVSEFGIAVNCVRMGVPVDTELARDVNLDLDNHDSWQRPDDVAPPLTELAVQQGTTVTGGYVNLYEWRRQMEGPLGPLSVLRPAP